MTVRQQLLVLAAVLILVVLAWLFPRPAGAQEAWRDSALPQSAFVLVVLPTRAPPLSPGALPTGTPGLLAVPEEVLTPPLSGTASWYRYFPGQAAAGPALRVGDWRGRVVRVCRNVSDYPTPACVVVRLSDFCGCYGTRLVDLDWHDFAKLADPRRGLVGVEVTW